MKCLHWAPIAALWVASACAGPLVLTTESSPPFNYFADDGQTIIGSATEVVQEMMRRAHVDYQITLYPWVRAFDMARKDADTCVYATTRTAEREKLFAWIGPVANNDWVLFARADSPIALADLEAARRYRIGGYHGDAVTVFLQGQQFAPDEAVDDDQNALKLQGGRIDLWATGAVIGPLVARKMHVAVKPVLRFMKTELYLACNSALPRATVEVLNATLRAMAKDGTTESIKRKYQ